MTIERLRSHLERHKGREQAFFSIAGLTALLEEVDRLQGALATCRELREYDNKTRDELKAQVDRLLANEAKRIEEVLVSRTYFAEDGTLMNADGTRSIFDDVDR